MSSSSKRQRAKRLKTLGNVGLAALAVATAGVVAALALAPRSESPVSDAVASAYATGTAVPTAAPVVAPAAEAVEPVDPNARLDGELSITAKLNGQNVRVDLPTNGAEVKAVALYFHGQGDAVNGRMNTGFTNALRDNGWAVASADFHKNAWGNAQTVNDSKMLMSFAVEKTGKIPSLFVGASMGGLNSLNAMRQGGFTPKCWYGTMPVVDLAAVSTVPNADTQIALAYPGAGTEGGNAAMYIDLLPADTAYRVVTSPGDTWVPHSKHGTKLASALHGLGRQVSTLAASGEHGDPSHFNAEDLKAFASNCHP